MCWSPPAGASSCLQVSGTIPGPLAKKKEEAEEEEEEAEEEE